MRDCDPHTSRVPLFAIALLLVACLAATAAAQTCGGFRVLVFSKTKGYRHASQITAGTTLVKSLGVANGFAVDTTEDSRAFTSKNLRHYASVVFLNTTGDVLDATQQTAFEGFVRGGGGFVGVHSAADTEYGWPFYGAALGAWFHSHPQVQSAKLTNYDPGHPSTKHLGTTFSHTDEWYNYRTNPAKNSSIRVLLTLDEKTYKGGNMGSPHPIAWCQPVGLGRSWYTGLGHTLATYSATFFQKHLLGGIVWASGAARQMTIGSFQAYGSATGTPTLALTGRLTTSRFDVVVSGGTNGTGGLLLISTCSASFRFGPYTLLANASPQHFLAMLPGRFDARGSAVYPLPRRFHFPAAAGATLFLQGAQTTPSLSLSNGLRVSLTPQ